MKSVHDSPLHHPWDDFIVSSLHDLEAKGLRRRLKSVTTPVSTRCLIEGRELLLFCTNDYLGLANHPRMKRAAAEAAQKWGTGSGASRLISGNISLYVALEKECASFKETESAVVFSSGYATNMGVISSLLGADDLILSDRLNHASIVDACRLSKARVVAYPHGDVAAVEATLRSRDNKGKALVVTDGVFSMDGDLAPLPDLVKVCAEADALLLVDDAHGTGVLGPKGGGSLDHFGLRPRGIIQVGTFSKALGSLGGFVAATSLITEYLVNRARSLIYSTALPPAILAANREALCIVREDTSLRFRLRRLTHYLKKQMASLGLAIPDQPTPIFPVIIGNAQETVRISNSLIEKGIFVPPIRPPTVPEGQSRLRISLSALHQEQDIDRLVQALGDHFRRGA
ncbi:MAG: 8-amino-7-oxononanoate synthase [Deltaproteobacteria bacterium]|nr:MAG: 8-amino-7-oxononanoate synthase [Deltaproteobacteria bacterium]